MDREYITLLEEAKNLNKNVFFDKKLVKIIFPYNELIVEEIKEVPGRIYMPMTKSWSLIMDAINSKPLRDFLDKFNFKYDSSIFEVKETKEKPKQINRIEYNKPILNIHFLYDVQLVELTKKIPGRKFVSEGKYWEVELNIDTYPDVNNVINHSKFEVTEEFISDLNKFKVEYLKKIELISSNIDSSKAHDADIEVVGLKGTLRPFQKAGVKYIADNKRVIVGDEMGLGKTIQAIASVVYTQNTPVLVVCPNSLKYNWNKEVVAWTDYTAKVINSTDQPDVTTDFTIMNYNSAVKFLENLKSCQFKSIIIDESHYCKESSTQRTKSIKEIIKNNNPELVIELTGTAVVNRPKELISQLEIVGKLQEFGGFWNFAKRYCGAYRGRFGLEMSGATNLEELHTKLRSLCYIRRNKEEVLKELPDKQINVIELDVNNRQEYSKAESDIVNYLKEEAKEDEKFKRSLNGLTEEQIKEAKKAYREQKSHAAEQAEHLVRINILKQLAAKGKLEEMINWIGEVVESGEKIVVFGIHKEIVDAVAKHFNCNKIDGSVISEDRQKFVEDFQNNPSTKVIVLNMKAGSVGLTLTAASILCFLEFGWTPGEHQQAEDRIHRMGQKNAANIFYFKGKSTIDEDIYDLLMKKSKITKAVNKGEYSEIGSMSIMSELIDRLESKGVKSSVEDKLKSELGEFMSNSRRYI
jgi:SWI/SNF-related matrix-associated actin-dependent regulator 1 of chromatin subfamily A